MENDILDMNILAMDMMYNYNNGIKKLKLESYIDTLKDEYPNNLRERNNKGPTLSPHISQYTINPKAEKLQLTNGELKKRIKYLQELTGKLKYIRTKGRMDIDFA